MVKKVLVRVGPYQVETLLGRGGSAEVYRARRDGARQEVALKVLRRGASRKDRKHFIEQARMASQVENPHLVAVVDSDLVAPRPWLAMELVPGEDLASLLRSARGRARALAPMICTSLLEAVRALHQAGLAHRDVAPANVLVGERDRVLLLDMGLLGKPAPGSSGTLAYMAPEGLRGEPQGPASDVYQVGAVLYEVLSGQVPHEHEGGGYIDFRREGEPPAPLLEVASGVSSSVSQLVDEMLDPDPRQRPDAEKVLRRARNIPAPWFHGPPTPDDVLPQPGRPRSLPGRAEKRRRKAGVHGGRPGGPEDGRDPSPWMPLTLGVLLLGGLALLGWTLGWF